MNKLNKTIIVKPTTNQEVSDNWGIKTYFEPHIFVTCNKKGKVNWPKALVYTREELAKNKKIKRLIKV